MAPASPARRDTQDRGRACAWTLCETSQSARSSRLAQSLHAYPLVTVFNRTLSESVSALVLLRSVIACCTWRPSRVGIHPSLEVAPALSGCLDIPSRDLSAVLTQNVKQDEQVF